MCVCLGSHATLAWLDALLCEAHRHLVGLGHFMGAFAAAAPGCMTLLGVMRARSARDRMVRVQLCNVWLHAATAVKRPTSCASLLCQATCPHSFHTLDRQICASLCAHAFCAMHMRIRTVPGCGKVFNSHLSSTPTTRQPLSVMHAHPATAHPARLAPQPHTLHTGAVSAQPPLSALRHAGRPAEITSMRAQLAMASSSARNSASGRTCPHRLHSSGSPPGRGATVPKHSGCRHVYLRARAGATFSGERSLSGC